MVTLGGTGSGTFSSVNDAFHTYQGIPNISGSWSLTYDESIIPAGGGYQYVDNHPLTTLVLSRPIGITTFSPADASAGLLFFNGVLSSVVIGGNVGGPGSMGGNNGFDDFAFNYQSPGFNLVELSVSVGTYQGFAFGGNLTGASNVIPEGGTISLVAAAALFATACRRRHSNSADW